MVFIFGTIVGSFLNVVIYRLHTGKSLGGRSHCLSCHISLKWYELLPIFSYVLLRARCRSCSSYIPLRYLAVELLTGLLFIMVWMEYHASAVLLGFYFVVVSLLVIILVYDMYHTIIPDEMVVALLVISTGIVIYTTVVAGESYMYPLKSLFGALLASGFFASLWYIGKGRWMGLGDAKLMFPLGVMAGFMGAVSTVVFSFWIGAVVSLTLIGIQKILRKGKTRLSFLGTPLTIKSEVPFAPFLIIAFLAVHFFHVELLSILQTITG